MKVFTLRYSHKNGTDTSVHASEEEADETAAVIIREWIDNWAEKHEKGEEKKKSILADLKHDVDGKGFYLPKAREQRLRKMN